MKYGISTEEVSYRPASTNFKMFVLGTIWTCLVDLDLVVTGIYFLNV